MNLRDIQTSAGPGQMADEGVPLIPPSGVDVGAFYNVVAFRQRLYENLLAASSAFNNNSIVFCLNWRGNRLLFTGDAEEASWEAMHHVKVLNEVDFLKISHHGSENGTPELIVLNIILPDDGVERYALVSTIERPHNGVPDGLTFDLIEAR